MTNNSVKSKAITSILLGIISLIPGIIFIDTAAWTEYFPESWFNYLEKYWFIFFPLAITCGVVGIKIGMKNLKLDKIPILIKILSGGGMIISGLGIISALTILIFGLYTAGFQ